MGQLYSKYKMFHFTDRIDKLPKEVDEIAAPLQVRIKPTNVCKHNCWYCAYRVDNLQLGKDMIVRDHIPKDKMMEIIDDLVEMDVKSVMFSGGGDPFHYPYLEETVEKLAQTNIKFASLTHGALLKGKIAELFAKHGTWLRISIDGWDDQSYAEYRGVKIGEFSKVMQNMSDFKKLGGKCYLGASLVIDDKNAPHIYEFVGRLKATGVDSVKISACIVSNDGKENNDYHRLFFDIAKQQARQAVADYTDEKFEVFDSYHELEEKFDKPYDWCPYLQICPVIGADLNIYTCHDKAYNLEDGVIASIKEQSFKDAWFGNKEQFFKVNPSCHCSHHCVVNEKNKMLMDYYNVHKEHLEFV